MAGFPEVMQPPEPVRMDGMSETAHAIMIMYAPSAGDNVLECGLHLKCGVNRQRCAWVMGRQGCRLNKVGEK